MKYRLPPLGALRAFEAAARLGRMTAAANELSVSPGAISRQVRQLEDHLGVPMFDGPKARPTLTAAGRSLQPVLTHAFQQIEDAVRALGQARQGPLDVACFSTFTVKWLIPRLFDFHAQHPGVEVRLRATGSGADAASEECDLLITVEDGTSKHTDAATLPLFAERLGPVMAPVLIAQTGLPRQIAELSSPTLLHTRTRRNAWNMWATSVGADLPAALLSDGVEYEHYFFTLEAAVRGLGVAVAPWHLVMDDVQAGRLVAPYGFAVSGYRYVARCRSGHPHPHLEVFSAWLQEQARAMEQSPSGAETVHS